MQDSLGGNAKTLMFANISPADYNQDETVTSLTYATRVKLITNTAEKHQVGGLGLSNVFSKSCVIRRFRRFSEDAVALSELDVCIVNQIRHSLFHKPHNICLACYRYAAVGLMSLIWVSCFQNEHVDITLPFGRFSTPSLCHRTEKKFHDSKKQFAS